MEGLIVCRQTQILDTTRLLKSCIQGAVGMLRDQNEDCQRSVRRVSILLSLLDEDGEYTGMGAPLVHTPAWASPSVHESSPRCSSPWLPEAAGSLATYTHLWDFCRLGLAKGDRLPFLLGCVRDAEPTAPCPGMC